MRCVIVKRPEFNEAHVYLFYESAAGRRPLDARGDVGEPVHEGGELPATYRWGVETYDAIRGALIGDALARDDSLADARTIRDRLLTMIEDEWART